MSVRFAIPRIGAFSVWRQKARLALHQNLAPDQVTWCEETAPQHDLFGTDAPSCGTRGQRRFAVPQTFLDLAVPVCLHREVQRFALLYEALWRLQREAPFMRNPADPLLARLSGLERAVLRDAHKMKSFLRFRDVGVAASGRRRFAAWFEPDHYPLELVAEFFIRRFGDMDWIVLTPDASLCSVDGEVVLGEGSPRPDLPKDAAEDLWCAYYATVFNPARVSPRTMQGHMPKKYWRNLPEAGLIPGLIRGAEARHRAMVTLAPPQRDRRPPDEANTHLKPLCFPQPQEQ